MVRARLVFKKSLGRKRGMMPRRRMRRKSRYSRLYKSKSYSTGYRKGFLLGRRPFPVYRRGITRVNTYYRRPYMYTRRYRTLY